jgi:hypothetical protein
MTQSPDNFDDFLKRGLQARPERQPATDLATAALTRMQENVNPAQRLRTLAAAYQLVATALLMAMVGVLYYIFALADADGDAAQSWFSWAASFVAPQGAILWSAAVLFVATMIGVALWSALTSPPVNLQFRPT